MTEQQAIKDLKFIRDAYKNLSENGSDRYRAVGKDINCSVEIETNADLCRHYAEALEAAIEVMEKQTPKKPIKTTLFVGEKAIGTYNPPIFKCPVCGKSVSGINGYDKQKYCRDCGQRLKWQDK